MTHQKIQPCLWFDDQAEEAVAFYTSVFPDSQVHTVTRYSEAGPGEPGSVMLIEFEIAGQRYQALNAGPQFSFTEAISLSVDCADQQEVDHYWQALTAGGGEPGPCGWLRDRFGLSWQITPRRLLELVRDPDPERAARVTEAMLKMGKIDVRALEEAYAG